MKKKKRIIVYWDYRRKDLLLPFHRLSAHIDFIFLFFRAEDEDSEELPFERIYWKDYPTPYSLLEKVNPDKVIFSDFSNINTVALNIACKNSSIPTFIQDHGVKADMDYYDIPDTARLEKLSGSKMATFKFYFSSVRPANAKYFFKIIQFFWRRYKSSYVVGMSKTHFKLRRAQTYLLFSAQNLRYYQQFDGVEQNEVEYTGNPYLDQFLIKGEVNAINYYLLIDDGLIEALDLSVDEKNEFISKLNQFCLINNSFLYVKLHPHDYKRTDLVTHDNIKYFRADNINDLVQNALGCFGISSTLVLPLIPQKRIILFRINKNLLQNELFKYCPSIFFDFKKFKVNEINFENIELDNQLMEEFIDKFLYKNDGKTLIRIQNILMR